MGCLRNRGALALCIWLILLLHSDGVVAKLSNSTALISSSITKEPSVASPQPSSNTLETSSFNGTATLQSHLKAVDSCSSVMSSMASLIPKRVCQSGSDFGDFAGTDCYTFTSYAFPQSFLPPPPCCDTCTIQASRVRVQYWAPEPDPATTSASPYTSVSDGYTFTSPSVYVIYSELYAQAECTLYGGGQIGNNVSAATVAYPPDALSTAQCYQAGDGGFNGWKSIDYENWLSPPPNSVATRELGCHLLGTQTLSDPAGTDLLASPQFSLPQGLSSLEPAWGEFGCKPWRYGSFDPPRVLTRADAMVPDPKDPATQASSATPAAQVPPPIVKPTITAAPQATPTAVSKDPKDPGTNSKPVPVPESHEPDSNPAPTSQASARAGGDPPQDPKNTKTDPGSSPTSVSQNPDPKPAAKSDNFPHLGAIVEPPSVDSSATALTGDKSFSQPSLTYQDQNVDAASSNIFEEPHGAPQAQTNQELSIGSATFQYHVDRSSNLVIASQTAFAGGTAATVAGAQISLDASANSVLIEGTPAPIQAPVATAAPSFKFGNEVMTADRASQYVVQGHTIVPGAPEATISGMPISLAPSATHVVIGTNTIPLASSQATAQSAFAFWNQGISVDSSSHFMIGGQTLIPGAPAVTVSGTPISLASSATQVVIAGSAISLQLAYEPTLPTVVVNGQVITANSASQFILAGQTILQGAPAITVSGTPVSIPPLSQPLVTIGSQAYTYGVDSSDNIMIALQTLRPGGPPVTLSGETVSEDFGSSELFVVQDSSTTSEGLGQIIAGALGKTATPSGTARINANFTGAIFTGKANGRIFTKGAVWMSVLAGLASVFMIGYG